MRRTPTLATTIATTLAFALHARAAAAEEDDDAPAPRMHPTAPWVITQLVPSPELAAGGGDAHFGLRWQVTPLLYSFGINRRVSPWRTFMVEPLVRQSGSIEIFGSPEYFFGRAEWLLRGGVRSYFPLAHAGEYLSMSLGSSAYWFEGKVAPAVEVGAYVLFGIAGVQLTYSPVHSPVSFITTFRIRYF